jgi:hypothetical protein
MELGEKCTDVNDKGNAGDANERFVKQVTARYGCEGGSCDPK